MTLKKLTPHKRKLLIIERLVEVPKLQKRFFWAAQMKMLKNLEERYSLDFLEIVTFPKKYDSLAYLVSEALKETMDKKWRAFYYKVDKTKYKEYNIGEKVGEDKEIKKETKTTKDFLNE